MASHRALRRKAYGVRTVLCQWQCQRIPLAFGHVVLGLQSSLLVICMRMRAVSRFTIGLYRGDASEEYGMHVVWSGHYGIHTDVTDSVSQDKCLLCDCSVAG